MAPVDIALGPANGFSFDQVDESFKIFGFSKRQHKGQNFCAQFEFHLVNHALEVGSHAIHFIYKSNARNFVLVSLSPHCFALRLHSTHGAKNSYSSVQNSERALHFHGEVDVSGGIDDIDAAIFPVTGGCGSCDGDSAFSLLLHPVHDGFALVHFTHFVSHSCVKEYALSCGGFSGVNVGNDSNVSERLYRSFFGRRF